MTMTGLLLRPTRAMCRRGRLPAWAVCARAGRWSDVAEHGTHQAPITTRTKPVWTVCNGMHSLRGMYPMADKACLDCPAIEA